MVRGEELNPNSNSTLMRCRQLGMDLRFVSRSEYGLRNEKAYLEKISVDHPSFQVVPEGGAGYYGMIGCQELLQEIKVGFDHIFVAQGTTTTSCGLLLGLNEKQQLHVVPVLKGFDSIGEMRSLLIKSGIESSLVNAFLDLVQVHDEFHFGGYGKFTNDLLLFIQRIYRETGLKLDPIYTAKAFYAMLEELSSEKYDHSTVVFLHTGGLQGVAGIEEKSKVKLF